MCRPGLRWRGLCRRGAYRFLTKCASLAKLPPGATLERRACQNSPIQQTHDFPMDIEHINAIGHALTDLTQRTLDLRGYL